VTEPVVVKTVSYFKVSALRLIAASGEVIKESFLQETKSITADRISRSGAFIGHQK
jgi:hypothetical protein